MADTKFACAHQVYYHGGCSDGYGAAWAIRAGLQWNDWNHKVCDFVPWYHGEAHPELTAGDPAGQCYTFLDCAPSRDIYERLTEAFGRKVEVIDHHETTLRTLGGRPGVHVDVSRSGAALAWRRFCPGKPLPLLIQYIQDYDLWHNDLADTQAINAYIQAKDFRFSEWDNLDKEISDPARRDMLLEKGVAILERNARSVERLLKHVHRRKIGEQEVYCVNSELLVTEVCHAILDKYKDCQVAGAYWYFNNVETFSLRSRPGGVNVALLSEQYGGGGGHPAAAGLRRQHALL